MADTYTENKAVLDEVANLTVKYRKDLDTATTVINNAVSGLTQMATTYGTHATDIDTMASDNPNDEALQAQKLEKDKLVADFQALKTVAQGMKTALEG